MQVENIRHYTSLEWEDYKNTPGFSYSWLKNEGQYIPPTGKMHFGTLVDRYLFEPHKYKGEQADLVKPLAAALRSYLGDALEYGQSQLSMTADFTHDGFTMPYKGRCDLKVGKLMVDLKVSSLDPIKAIEYFRYDRQLTGYVYAGKCDKGIVLSINPKTKKISPIQVPMVTDWWEYQILKYGSVSKVR